MHKVQLASSWQHLPPHIHYLPLTNYNLPLATCHLRVGHKRKRSQSVCNPATFFWQPFCVNLLAVLRGDIRRYVMLYMYTRTYIHIPLALYMYMCSVTAHEFVKNSRLKWRPLAIPFWLLAAYKRIHI